MEENREVPGRVSEYTVTGVISDGAELNQAVKDIRELGIGADDLIVVLKRKDTSEPEPFPEGTRYITVPDDRRGLEVPIGFAIAFVVFGIFFALTTPAIGLPTLIIFVSLAAILLAGSLTRVGIDAILTDMGAPSGEADSWNEQFEMGKVLMFICTSDRRMLRPIREILQGLGATYYLDDHRLQPRAIHQATLRRAGGGQRPGGGSEDSVSNRAGGA